MHNGDNNSHTQFVIPGDDDDTPYETYDLDQLGRDLRALHGADDYEGYMDVTLVATGDVIRVEVSYHVTEDGLVDVEAV
jgi:hypothetical protein